MRTTLVCLVCLLALLGKSICAQDILSNSGFDANTGTVQFSNTPPDETYNNTAFPDWKVSVVGANSSASFTVSTNAAAISALNVLEITRTMASECHLDKNSLFKLINGHVYRMSYWGKNISGTGQYKMNLPLYTAGGDFLEAGPEVYATLTSNWQTIEKTFVAQHGSDTVGKGTLRLGLESNGLHGMFDDVRVEDITVLNRMTNGGFEDSGTDCLTWTNFAGGSDQGSASIVTTASEGQRALRLVRQYANGGDANISLDGQRLPWLGNHDIFVSLDLKDDPTLATGEYVTVKVAAFDSAGTFISCPASLTQTFHAGTGVYSWYLMQAAGAMPNNTASVSLSLRVVNSAGQQIRGDVLVDNIVVRDMTASVAEDITARYGNANGGFELSASSPASWTNFAGGSDQGSASIVTTASEGQRALRLVRQYANGGDANLSKDDPNYRLPWRGSRDIYVALDVRDDPTLATGEYLKLTIAAFNSAGTFISCPITQTLQAGSGQWNHYAIQPGGVMPANTASISPSLRVVNSAGQQIRGDVLVDHMVIADVSKPSYTWADKPVMTYYYMWFTPDSFAGLDSDKGASMLDIHPLVGAYDSADSTVIDTHIQMAGKGLIDSFAVSYDPTKTDANNKLASVFSLAYDHNFKVCINLEAAGLTQPQILDGLRYYLNTYRENYVCMRIDEKPVVYIWGTWVYTPAQWSQMFSQLSSEGLSAIYYVSNQTSTSYLGPLRSLEEYVLVDIADSALPGHYQTLRSQITSYNNNNPNNLAHWTATIMPGFDERLIPGRAAPLGWKDRNDGAYYNMTIDAAMGSSPDEIHVSTWNELAEHSHIEPMTEFGYKYVDLTSECVRRLRAN